MAQDNELQRAAVDYDYLTLDFESWSILGEAWKTVTNIAAPNYKIIAAIAALDTQSDTKSIVNAIGQLCTVWGLNQQEYTIFDLPKCLAQIGHYGATKYGRFNYKNPCKEPNKSPLNHAIQHFLDYIDSVPHDKFGDYKYQLAAAIFNLLMYEASTRS